jgi:hypothetical protein
MSQGRTLAGAGGADHPILSKKDMNLRTIILGALLLIAAAASG